MAQQNAQTLANILALLHTERKGGTYLPDTEQQVPSDKLANHPDKMLYASSSSGTSGPGS